MSWRTFFQGSRCLLALKSSQACELAQPRNLLDPRARQHAAIAINPSACREGRAKGARVNWQRSRPGIRIRWPAYEGYLVQVSFSDDGDGRHLVRLAREVFGAILLPANATPAILLWTARYIVQFVWRMRTVRPVISAYRADALTHCKANRHAEPLMRYCDRAALIVVARFKCKTTSECGTHPFPVEIHFLVGI